MTDVPAPVGECRCHADYLCNYCDEMMLWAHEHLYGAEDDCLLEADRSYFDEEEDEECDS